MSNMNNDYQTLLEMWRDEKNKRQAMENELAIVKDKLLTKNKECETLNKVISNIRNEQ
tara:strand:- start:2478 stop:2651 length:174 start_codon:yes stop_codon:yes gene_type:complete